MNIFIELKNAFKCNHFNLWKSDLIEIPTLDNEKKAIEKVFDDQFNVKKDATVELKNMNKDIENLNNNPQKNLNAILKKYNKKQWLQENKFFWQNGRTVLPLISKYKNKVKGVIHGESSTHQTSFFEPLEIINNKSANDALIDQLRACKNSQDILKFEKWFNSNIESKKLDKIICQLLRDRSISRTLAAKWLSTLIEHRDKQIIRFTN